MLEHTIIQYFLSSFLWTFCKPLLFTVTVNFLQTQDFKKEQKQKNSFAFHSQVWATRSHSWKKSWGSRCLKKTEEIQPWHDSEKNFSPVRNTRCLLWMKESQHSTEMHGAKVWSASGSQASWNRIHSPSGCRFPESEPGTGHPVYFSYRCHTISSGWSGCTKIWSCVLLSAIWRTQIYSGSDTEAESDHDHTAVSSTVC